jgi:hypothetical protein
MVTVTFMQSRDSEGYVYADVVCPVHYYHAMYQDPVTKDWYCATCHERYANPTTNEYREAYKQLGNGLSR